MMPAVPPFAVTASYQNSQYANGTYTTGGSQVFSHLVSPPSSGTAAETAADSAAEALGFSAFGAANAVQTLTVTGTPSGGTFELEWGDAVTTALAYNATATQVQSALDALTSVPAATGGTNEIQTVTITGAPTGGTFTLTYSGQTTAAIAFNAVGSAVQTALLALSNIGAGNVTVTGSAGGPYTVTFRGTLAATNVAQMTATGSLTGGTSPAVAVTTATGGVAKVQNITVSGSNGGPWTVTFANVLSDEPVAEIALAANNLTGGTSPSVAIVVSTAGTAAFVNQALLNAHQQFDQMRNFYDAASGNHF